ncbi:Hypothetical predicted protein [Mytilus galloprovincialis]|uniref:RNase H type-1 domain-containing protein n=1 Tax=Mytilus galloprovincialis TaxID=29158 RepID=A0A8B6DIU1_MYTGA|nr:Hypothetical predicted protein [Mytilus galloprovincialis]
MYLDDGIGGGSEISKANFCSLTVRYALRSAGFLIAEEKCSWEPSQSVTWLGLVWDMKDGIVYVTETRLNKLKDTLNVIIHRLRKGEIKVTARFLASIIGQIISMQGAMGPVVRLRKRSMYDCLLYRASWNAPVLLNSKALDEIVFWKENVAILNGRDLSIVEQYSCIVYSDASGIGFGGYAVSISDTEVMGSWNSVESLKSSTWRELEAVYRVLLSLLVTLQGETIKWYTDNQNIVYIIKQGSKKGDLQLIAIKIANVCKLNNIVLLPQWVPREKNVKADQISKSVDCDDWGIDPEVYSVLDNLWGPHTVDRFASDYNTKCLVFNSKHWCPNTSGINAFDQDWKSEINWIVPPPSLVSKCIQKMRQEKSIGTLIVPYWRSAPFWPILNVGIEGSQTFASFVGDSRVLSSSVVIRGRGKNGLFGKTDTNFSMLALKIRF